MVRSMTGYGRGTLKDDKIELSVDIKTINHRYLDIFIRMPRQFIFLEDKVRQKINKIISRGKIELFVNIEQFNEEISEIKIDLNLAELYYQSLNKIKEKFKLRDDINVSLISRFPDIINPIKSDKLETKLWSKLEIALEQALNSLVEMREKEGEIIKNNILSKLLFIEKHVSEIAKVADYVTKDYTEKLMNRLHDLLEKELIDESRIATEVAIYADRCCIDEELVRIGSHLNQFRDILNEDDVQGKKLDFLVQESIREINTIGSKSSSLIITKNVLQIKSEIEKIREQVQNIE